MTISTPATQPRIFIHNAPPATVVLIEPDTTQHNRLCDILDNATSITLSATGDTLSEAIYLTMTHQPNILILPSLTDNNYTLTHLEILKQALPSLAIAVHQDTNTPQTSPFTFDYLESHHIDASLTYTLEASILIHALHLIHYGHKVTAPPHQPLQTYGSANLKILSQREVDVLEYLCLGKNNKEISEQLFIAPSTVKSHIASLKRKLGTKNRVDLALYALRNNLVPQHT